MKGNRRYARDGMHFFVLRAVPRHRQGKLIGVRGAYVSCWINFRLYEGALALAKFYVRNQGWAVRSVDSHVWINGPSDAAAGTLRYFREAQKRGASFVFHQWRPKAP